MDREQIRQAFLFSESTRARVERFRDERLGRILSCDIGAQLQNSWKRVTHLVPLAALNGSLSIDLSTVHPFSGLVPKFTGTLDRRYNVDGVMCASDLSRQFPSRQFIQIFRTGILEHTTIGAMDGPNKRHDVPGQLVENGLLEEFSSYFGFYRSQFVPMPVVAMVSLLNVERRNLLGDDYGISRAERQFDRATIILPELVFESYDMDVKESLMPLLDTFWQAGGHRRSPNYNRVT